MSLKRKDETSDGMMTKEDFLKSLSREDLENLYAKRGISELLTNPQPDEDGTVPEFVNISKKVQCITVPNHKNSTLTIPIMGILRGAQWRAPYTRPNVSWGNTPPFLERVRDKNGYDKRYLLTVEQAVDHIRRLKKNKTRVQQFVDNMCIVYDDAGEIKRVYNNSFRAYVDSREPDDRIEVIRASADCIRGIEERERLMQDGMYSTKPTSDMYNTIYKG